MEGQRRLWGTFRDARLEAAYRAHAAEDGRTHYRIGAVTAVTLWLAVALIDGYVGVTAANTRHLMMLRLASMPALIPVALVGWLPPARFERVWQIAGVLGAVIVLGTIVLMNATAPDPDQFASLQALIGFCIATLGGYAMLPIRPLPAFATAVPAGAALVVVTAMRFEVAPWVATAAWVFAANAAGVAAALVLEHSRRRVFSYARMCADERARSDALVANLLPASIAERLRVRRTAIAEAAPSATVLFADLVGFTPYAERVSPEQVVASLDAIFTRFDELAERHGLEKIKTMGDAYMAVAGVPIARPDHAAAAADMALAMRAFLTAERMADGSRLAVRIGLATGPLVAGVIGKARMTYDLWGDTVNTASRMESQGVPDAIQVTDAVKVALGAGYDLEERGVVSVKGKGDMRTWILHGKRVA